MPPSRLDVAISKRCARAATPARERSLQIMTWIADEKILFGARRRRPLEIAKQGISTAELTEALRHQGFANITKIRAAILENDGRISVLGDPASTQMK